MTTFIKAKLKKSDDQPNIDKYRVAANITEYHIISILFFHRIIIKPMDMIQSCYTTWEAWDTKYSDWDIMLYSVWTYPQYRVAALPEKLGMLNVLTVDIMLNGVCRYSNDVEMRKFTQPFYDKQFLYKKI